MSLNLLPWRDQLRRKKIFLIYKIIFFVIILMGLLGIYMENRLSSQFIRIKKEAVSLKIVVEGREKELTKNTVCLNSQLIKESLYKIHNNQIWCNNFIKLLADVSRCVPSRSELTQLVFNSKGVVLSGVSDNNHVVNMFISNLSKLDSICDVKLSEVNQLKDKPLVRFIIKAGLQGEKK